MNKPCILKGDQIVIISDATSILPRAYMYRHKLHNIPYEQTLTAQYEERYIFKKLTDGEPTEPKVKKIFKEKSSTLIMSILSPVM